MHYFALLLSQEPTGAPDPEEMAEFQAFHAKAASAIRAGDALAPSATGVRITGGPDAPTITDGPFAEAAEVACGYYVFEAENLDEALALAQEVPVARFGAVEVWPIVHYMPPPKPQTITGLRCCSSRRTRSSHRAVRNGTTRRTAPEVRRGGGRSGQRRRAPSSAIDSDDGAGARR